MNILMLGLGKGSFAVRGKQLGSALGARVDTHPHPGDLAWADVVVLIKQAGPQWAAAVHAAGKPIVWDALDFWRQPEENAWSEPEARAALNALIAQIRPVVTVGATRAMAEACDGVYLPHHARPGLSAMTVRAAVGTVAYEGSRKYLGRWGKAVTEECARRGWTFLINPPDLAVADIIVAFRDGEWDGWACRAWKSGVKLVNALAAGRPMVTQASAAVDDIAPCVSELSSREQLSDAFDAWSPCTIRECYAQTAATRHEFALARVAKDYREILERAA